MLATRRRLAKRVLCSRRAILSDPRSICYRLVGLAGNAHYSTPYRLRVKFYKSPDGHCVAVTLTKRHLPPQTASLSRTGQPARCRGSRGGRPNPVHHFPYMSNAWEKENQAANRFSPGRVAAPACPFTVRARRPHPRSHQLATSPIVGRASLVPFPRSAARAPETIGNTNSRGADRNRRGWRAGKPSAASPERPRGDPNAIPSAGAVAGASRSRVRAALSSI